MGKYRSTHTGPQIDTGVDAALNPDIIATENSDSLITSGAVYNGLSDKSAVLANPTLAGTESALDSVEIDGTKFKVGAGDPYTSNPAMDGTASPGSSNDYARGDHVHPSDTAKAEKTDLASIKATGATNATGATITNGTYFYLNNVLVQATADIANGATFTIGTNYTDVTAGALNELKSALTWKYLDTVTGTTAKSLPAGWSEIFVAIKISNQAAYTFLLHVVASVLPSGTMSFRGGYYGASDWYMNWIVNVSTSSIALNDAVIIGTSYKNTTTMAISYR